MRSSTNYNLHVLAEAYGQCTWRFWDCSTLPCACANFLTQLRRPDGVGILLYNSHPLSPFSIGPIYPNDYSLQQWDSRVAGQTSPPGRTWNTGGTLGEATLQFTEVILTTACNILPSQKVVERTAFVLQCEPKFLPNNTHVAPATPPSKVQVYLDSSSMSAAATPLDQAIQDWNTNLFGTGMAFERTGTDCGTGPGCVRVEAGQVQTCGAATWDGYDPGTGFFTGGLRLRIHANWGTFSSASLQRTFAHELGHFLGLHNYATATACGVDDAVMRDDFECSPTASPGVSVTGSDGLPAAKTMYGTGPKTTCGW